MPLFFNNEDRRQARQARRMTRRSERQLWKQTKLTAKGERQSARQSMIQNIAAQAATAFAPAQQAPAFADGGTQYGDQEPVAVTSAGFGKMGWIVIALVLALIMKKK